VKVPQFDIAVEWIHRFQLDFNRISQANHVAGMNSTKCKLGLAVQVVVVGQSRNMNESIDEDIVESYMKSLIADRGHDARESFSHSMAQPGDRPEPAHVSLGTLCSSLPRTAGLRQFQQGG